MCVGTWQDSHVYVTGGQDGAAIFWDSRTAESVHKVKGGNSIKFLLVKKGGKYKKDVNL